MNKKSVNNDDFMYEKLLLVTELYYQYKYSQQEISKRMGISRPWVSKLLKRAEEMGMVRIEVMTPTAGVRELENELIEKFELNCAKVVKSFSDETIQTNIGRAAANYVLSIIEPNDVIGISWGNSLSIMADQFIPMYYPKVSVVPIMGGIGVNPTLLSNQIAAHMASALNAKAFLLHAPAVTVGKNERDIFLKDPTIHEIIKKGEKTDILLTGLGSLRNSTIQSEGYISEKEIDELEKLGAVGDIALRFIDAKGNLIQHNIQDRLVASELEIVKAGAKRLIGVAAGHHKVPVIRAALSGKWLDTLITDYNTAKELLV
jgi:deoxyribonucleoside regulator